MHLPLGLAQQSNGGSYLLLLGSSRQSELMCVVEGLAKRRAGGKARLDEVPSRCVGLGHAPMVLGQHPTQALLGRRVVLRRNEPIGRDAPLVVGLREQQQVLRTA